MTQSATSGVLRDPAYCTKWYVVQMLNSKPTTLGERSVQGKLEGHCDWLDILSPNGGRVGPDQSNGTWAIPLFRYLLKCPLRLFVGGCKKKHYLHRDLTVGYSIHRGNSFVQECLSISCTPGIGNPAFEIRVVQLLGERIRIPGVAQNSGPFFRMRSLSCGKSSSHRHTHTPSPCASCQEETTAPKKSPDGFRAERSRFEVLETEQCPTIGATEPGGSLKPAGGSTSSEDPSGKGGASVSQALLEAARHVEVFAHFFVSRFSWGEGGGGEVGGGDMS